MSINYDIYGQPETWQNVFYLTSLSTGAATLLKASGAKVPTWKETYPDSTSYATSQLRWGVLDGKITEREPIDKSIATIGMAVDSAPVKHFGMYANYAGQGLQKVGTAEIGEEGEPINIFWYEANNPTAYATYGNNTFCRWRMPLEDLKKRTWAPDGENGEGTTNQNGNYYIAPLMEFGARTFVLQIVVYVQNSTTHQPPYTSEPTGTWRTLDDWKNNYSDHTISGCQLRVRILSTYNATSGAMGYYYASWDTTQYRKGGPAILDEIKLKFEDGVSDTSFYSYGIQAPGTNAPLFRLFGAIDGMYQWTQSLRPIALIPDWIEESDIYFTSNNQIIFPLISYSDEVYEAIMSATAHFGVPFTPAKSTATAASNCTFLDTFDDVDLCLPIIDEQGITHGEYTRGTENLDNDYMDLDKSSDINYDPTKPPAPTPSGDPIYPSTPGFSLAVGNGSVNYIINKEEWKRIWDDIYGGSKSDWKNLIEGLQLYGANPLNAILNYRWYPFTFSSAYTDPLRLGSTIVKPTSHAYNYIGDKAEGAKKTNCSFKWNVDKNFINIRKTKARLWLPFYGFYDIPPTLLIDKELELEFQYNLPNDTGVWFISFDNVIYDYVECQPYIEIPISGDNSTQIAAAKLQRNLQIAGTVAGAAVAIAGGAALAAPGLAALGTAAVEGAWGWGGGVAGTIAAGAANVGPLISEGFITGATAAGLMGAGGAALATGPKVANTVMQSALKIGTLSTNIPIHSAASDSTFLSLPMYPYLQTFTAEILEGYNSGEYKLKVGIACDVWKGINEMPENSLLQATGIADSATTNMEITEVQELNSILQTGFFK